jgi:hypothetical protein
MIMKSLDRRDTNRFSLLDAMRAKIAAYLYTTFRETEGLLGNLDRWTQRRITEENMAKLALVLNSEDPVEACYQDLIREIDTEAETGIFLTGTGSMMRHLHRVVDEPGVSANLHTELETVAPILFPDEAARSGNDLDLVWVTIRALHDRAHVDATVSEIIMTYLVNDADSVRDMSDAMRALQYSFHEDRARRRSGLSPMIDDRESHELLIMVTELARRSGSYDDRVAEIRRQADTD